MGCSSSKPGATTPGGLFASKGDPSSRSATMLREAAELHRQLGKAGKDLRALGSAATAALDASNTVLGTSLPHVYEDKSAIDAAMTQPNVSVGGKAFNNDALTKVKGDLQVKIQSEAYGPLDAWMAKYEDAQKKQKLVNKAYDGMIAARTKAAVAKEAAEVMAGKVQSTDPKLLELQRKLQEMQDGYTIATNKHDAEESAQYTRLEALNKEAASVQTIMRQALGHVGEALVTAREAIPDQPLYAVEKSTVDVAAAAAAAANASAAAAAAAHAAAKVQQNTPVQSVPAQSMPVHSMPAQSVQAQRVPA